MKTGIYLKLKFYCNSIPLKSNCSSVLLLNEQLSLKLTIIKTKINNKLCNEMVFRTIKYISLPNYVFHTPLPIRHILYENHTCVFKIKCKKTNFLVVNIFLDKLCRFVRNSSRTISISKHKIKTRKRMNK